jgi:HEAT repeat protein
MQAGAVVALVLSLFAGLPPSAAADRASTEGNPEWVQRTPCGPRGKEERAVYDFDKTLKDLRYLVLDLESKDLDVRCNAAARLGAGALFNAQIGTELWQYVPDLVAHLQDPHPFVRESLVRALGSLMPEPPAVAKEPLMGLLNDPDTEVRRGALASLARMSLAPSDIDHLLARLRQDESPNVRSNAARWLEHIYRRDPSIVENNPRIIPALIDALDDRDGAQRRVVDTLAAMGSASAAAVPKLREIVRSNAPALKFEKGLEGRSSEKADQIRQAARLAENANRAIEKITGQGMDLERESEREPERGPDTGLRNW